MRFARKRFGGGKESVEGCVGTFLCLLKINVSLLAVVPV